MQSDDVTLDHGAGTSARVVHELVPVVGAIGGSDAVLVVLGSRGDGGGPLGDNGHGSGGLDVLDLEANQAVGERVVGGLGGLVQRGVVGGNGLDFGQGGVR